MLDIPLILWLNLSVVYRVHEQSNKSATAVEKEATGDSKLNDSPFKMLRYLCLVNQLTCIDSRFVLIRPGIWDMRVWLC